MMAIIKAMEACGMALVCYQMKKYIFCIKLEACPYCTSSNSHVNSAYGNIYFIRYFLI